MSLPRESGVFLCVTIRSHSLRIVIEILFRIVMTALFIDDYPSIVLISY